MLSKVLRLDAHAVIAHANHVFGSCFLAPKCESRAAWSPRYLIALPIRFLNTCDSRIGIPKTTGRLVRVTEAPLSSIERLQLQQCPIHGSATGERFHVDFRFRRLRVGQHVVDEFLHAVHAGDGELHELVGLVAELVLVTLRKQLRVRLHHPQRLLQLMGDDERESAKLLVGTNECFFHILDAKKRPDRGDQNRGIDRLAEVVIAPVFEAGNDIQIGESGRGEEDDRQRGWFPGCS